MVPEQPADVVKSQGQEHVLEQGIDQENKLVLEQPADIVKGQGQEHVLEQGIDQEHNRYKGNQLILLKVKARNMVWNREKFKLITGTRVIS